MIKILIVLAIIAFIIYKIKDSRETKAYLEEKERKYKEACAARKAGGEPSVSEALPAGLSRSEETVTGPNGKEYPYSTAYYDHIALYNYTDSSEEQYEYDPVLSILAAEYYVEDFIKRLKQGPALHEVDIRTRLKCIYDLGESYAYPEIKNNDLVMAEHYTVRRLKDRKRALEGNGYYKNAYGFPVDEKKAMEYYELPYVLSQKFSDQLSVMGNEGTATITKCWLQQAILFSAGRDAEQAKKLFSQAYQMAVYLSMEDLIMECMRAIIDGYPRNPALYEVSAGNMLADWACNSDLGLAMYLEYKLHADKLDKKRLAESPEEVVKLSMEQAKENHYAAYLLGRAMYFGYGISQDEKHGRALLEAAAEDGCISALYLLTQLSIGYPEDEKKWKAALDRAVSIAAATGAPMRELLKQSGASVTEKRFADFKQQFDSQWEKKQQEAHAQAAAKAEQEASAAKPKFAFPSQISTRDGAIWQLDFDYGVVAIYRNMDTAETKTLDRLDIERLQVSPDVFM